MTATQLSARYPVSRQAVTKHLAALSAAGLLRAQRQGREVLYEIAGERLTAASSWLDEVGRRWDRRLEALARKLDEGTAD